MTTMHRFPVKGFMVVDNKGIQHHKRGESGFYLGEKTVQKKAEWFNNRYPSQGPFSAKPVEISPEIT